MIDAKYYVYEWFIVETNEVFYVGKGSANRVTSMKDRNNYFKNIRKKYKCDYRILKYFENEDDAFNFELERGLQLKKIGQAKASYCFGKYEKYIDKSVLKKMENTQFKKKSKPWNTGLKMNEEYREKCRKRSIGTIQSEETKKKRSDSLIGHSVSEYARERITLARMKRVILTDVLENEQYEFCSISEAAKYFNVTQSALTRILKNNSLYRKRYYISYANTEITT